ncbi:MAG: MFS transporter [Colwellia sp.]|nr:MFS transporter [Colwellia sp.]
MRQTFISLFSLFLSCFILLLGNGLINVLLPVRMGLDGISTEVIGLVLSLYFVGLLFGSLYCTSLIKRTGHIRLFAGCVSLGAVSILICSLYAEPILWGAMRIVMGFCIACAFTAMESWLSDSSSKETRGQVLAIHNAVMLAGLFGGQFFMNVTSPQDNALFVIAGILLCAAVIPMVLSRHAGPVIEEVTPMPLRLLYRRSPLGVVSCLVSGMIYSAVFSLLPIFAKEYDIIGVQLSLYMGVAILGAFIFQFPVGYLSDRFDRRTVLLVLLIISAAADIAVAVLASLRIEWAVFIATAVTSGIIACTYPLSITEAFDKLRQSEMISAMGSMILAFAIGGIIGPYSASLFMDSYGGVALFYFLAVVQLLLACFVIFRMIIRQALPIDEQEHFVMQGTAASSAIVLDPRIAYIPRQTPPKK